MKNAKFGIIFLLDTGILKDKEGYVKGQKPVSFGFSWGPESTTDSQIFRFIL